MDGAQSAIEWTVRECKLALEVGVRDLQSQRCHIGGGFCSGGCNDEEHYCDCEAFKVVRVDA